MAPMSDGDFTGTHVPPPEEEHRFPCEQCGSQLHFDAGEQVLTCPYCGHVQTVHDHKDSVAELREIDFESALGGQLARAEIEETRVVTCPNCGAQTEFSETTQADRCPFCDTPVVTDTGTHRHLKPQGVLPFSVTEDQARDGLRRWLKGLWFAPNGLKEYARDGRRMNGIYVPYWTFDADTRSSYRGQRGIHYDEVRTVTRNGRLETVRVRKTRWRTVSGRVARQFDDLLILASRSLPKRYADALDPWDLSQLAPYSPQYLAGFRAEGYQVELEDGYTEARQVMDRVIHQDVRRDIGGDDQRVGSVSTDVSNVTFKHILLPIWLAAYKYQGRTFRFVVNGQTGEVQGERPYSKVKIAIAVVLGLIVAAIAAYLYALSA